MYQGSIGGVIYEENANQSGVCYLCDEGERCALAVRTPRASYQNGKTNEKRRLWVLFGRTRNRFECDGYSAACRCRGIGSEVGTVIYFDNAATTYPKPRTVVQALQKAAVRYGANPGRAGHTMAYKTAERVYAARAAVSDFFSLGSPGNVIFTKNSTTPLQDRWRHCGKRGYAPGVRRILQKGMRKRLRILKRHCVKIRLRLSVRVHPMYSANAHR